MAESNEQHNEEVKKLLQSLNTAVGDVVGPLTNTSAGQLLASNEINQKVAFFGADMTASLRNIFQVMQGQTDFMTREAAEAEFRADIANKQGEQPINITVESDSEAVEAAESEKKKTKGFLSKIGGMFSGAGMGAAATIASIGLAAAGIALVVVSITKLIEVMSSLDAGMIKDKVITLLSIAGAVEKDGKSFIGEGAKFFLAMIGIGLGLLVFGLGAGVAGLTIRLVKEGFAEKVIQLISKLMEIPKLLGGAGPALANGGVFLAIMIGIGLGLLVFGLGQAVASLTIRLAKENFAEKVVHIVTTLLSISELLGGPGKALAKGGVFLAIMMGIGIGLLVFGAGTLIASVVLRLTQEKFAEKTINLVTALLEIPDLLGGAEKALVKGGVFLAVMLGIGAGLLVFGLGLGVAALTTRLVKEGFAQNVVDLVSKLLEVNDLVGGIGGALLEGGTFVLTMLGLAIGLYIFAAGAVAMALGVLVGGSFAQDVVNTVSKLLEINNLVGSIGGALVEGGTFFITMLAIAAGLYMFAIGTIATGIGDLVAGDFAQRTVDTVKKLLEISSLVDSIGGALVEGGTFFITMLAIAAGLFVFAIGSGVGGGIQKLVGSDFAQNTVDSVRTLLTIASLPPVDTLKFILMMAGIAAGLLIFSLGEAAGGIASFIGGAGTGGKGVAESIKEKIDILMEVARNVKVEDVDNLKLVLTGMRQAIKNFTGGLGGAVAEGAGNVIRWFTGANRNNPMDKILEFARSADDLEKGTDALEKLARAFTSVGRASQNNNIQAFADSLASVAQSIRNSLDKMLWGGGMGQARTDALEALAAVNLGSEGLSVIRDTAAARQEQEPNIINSNNTTRVESSGGTTNIFNGGGELDSTLAAFGNS